MTTRPTLDEALGWNWKPVVVEVEGGYRLTVPGLPDLEMFDEDRDELMRDFNDALKALLATYVRTGRAIPLPVVVGSEVPPRADGDHGAMSFGSQLEFEKGSTTWRALTSA